MWTLSEWSLRRSVGVISQHKVHWGTSRPRALTEIGTQDFVLETEMSQDTVFRFEGRSEYLCWEPNPGLGFEYTSKTWMVLDLKFGFCHPSNLEVGGSKMFSLRLKCKVLTDSFEQKWFSKVLKARNKSVGGQVVNWKRSETGWGNYYVPVDRFGTLPCEVGFIYRSRKKEGQRGWGIGPDNW